MRGVGLPRGTLRLRAPSKPLRAKEAMAPHRQEAACEEVAQGEEAKGERGL